MNEKDQHLQQLKEIKTLMAQSSKFLSLSGLSGVLAGIYALIGAVIAYYYINYLLNLHATSTDVSSIRGEILDLGVTYYQGLENKLITFVILDAGTVFMLAVSTSVIFAKRKAKKQNITFINKATYNMLFSLAIPLLSGGLFCIILLRLGVEILIPSATLIFYGLALLNASKYTLREIKYLAITIILIGLTAGFMLEFGLFFWALGFGVMHIVYGGIMYWKYERN